MSGYMKKGSDNLYTGPRRVQPKMWKALLGDASKGTLYLNSVDVVWCCYNEEEI